MEGPWHSTINSQKQKYVQYILVNWELDSNFSFHKLLPTTWIVLHRKEKFLDVKHHYDKKHPIKLEYLIHQITVGHHKWNVDGGKQVITAPFIVGSQNHSTVIQQD